MSLVVKDYQKEELKDSWPEQPLSNGPFGSYVLVHDNSLLKIKLIISYSESQPLFGVKTEEPPELKKEKKVTFNKPLLDCHGTHKVVSSI